MVLQIANDRTERVFRVAPGADWKRIALTYDGVRFESEASGGLTARAGEGALTLSAPVAFQDTAEGRVSVDVRYVVEEQGARVSFEVGSYDDSLPLTIDPVLQATYFGFGGSSSVNAMTVDPVSGDLIVTGISNGLGAAFSELTLGNRDDELKSQGDSAWPARWRRTRLFPAVDAMQLERFRRRTMMVFDSVFPEVDVLIGPNFAGGALVATNATGHPCIALKAGFVERPARDISDLALQPEGPRYSVPRAVSLWAGLFREDVLITLARALEAVLQVDGEHPPLARQD